MYKETPNKIILIKGIDMETITFKEHQQITGILKDLSKIKFIRASDQQQSLGWSYSLEIYTANSKCSSVCFQGNDLCIINSIKYKVKYNSNITIQSIYSKYQKQKYLNNQIKKYDIIK